MWGMQGCWSLRLRFRCNEGLQFWDLRALAAVAFGIWSFKTVSEGLGQLLDLELNPASTSKADELVRVMAVTYNHRCPFHVASSCPFDSPIWRSYPPSDPYITPYPEPKPGNPKPSTLNPEP